eukprot:2625791-Pyramimonas_sp.AAC.1
MSAHPSHVSWPHEELHLRPRWEGPYATTAPMLAQPRARMPPPHPFRHTVTRFVALRGAPSKAPVG